MLSLKPWPQLLWFCAFITTFAGFGWLWMGGEPLRLTLPMPAATPVSILHGPVVATMDSPVFIYEKPWQLSAIGADPTEPADPWREPAGSLRFTYTGSELDLLLAPGDYWGYLYITIDGQPANRLPVIPGNVNSRGEVSGYRTLYAPEQQSASGPTPQWVRVHYAADATLAREVYLELWRSWGQTPLRAVAVDGLPPPSLPRWPGVALLLLAGWAALAAIQSIALPSFIATGLDGSIMRPRVRRMSLVPPWVAQNLAGVALLLLGVGVLWMQWIITIVALLLLAWCGVQRPALWLAALLLGLPFYYSYTLPIFPTRAFSLIDIGILGGIGVLTAHWLLARFNHSSVSTALRKEAGDRHLYWRLINMLVIGIVGWALLAAVQADKVDLALREWRTVFLTGGLFALLLVGALRRSAQPIADQHLLFGAWIMGAMLVALAGLWQYINHEMLINAEGVWRVRAFYGSPNNLALYLERALAPTVAFALFAQHPLWRWLAAGTALILGSALLLTFSKGALLFGVPALLAMLWIGGLILLRHRGQSRRLLWAVAGIGMMALLALTPFLGTERFQRLLDFQQGTGFVRLQLWRSAWQMALDHPLFGVGPDNFLYAYRSLYLLPTAWQEPNLNHPHNWPLDWWTRVGIPGLLLAVLWFATMVLGHWRRLCANQQPVLNLGLLAAGVAALAHGLIDASYALPDLIIIWILLTYLPSATSD